MKTTIFCLSILVLFMASCNPAASPTPTSAPTIAPPVIDQSLILTKSPELILAVNKPFRETSDANVKVHYTLPAEDQVLLASELVFSEKLLVDIYYPPDYHFDKKLPMVILAHGYPWSEKVDKDMPQHIDWAKLIAVSGMIVVAAQTGNNPYEAQNHVLDYLAANADRLGIDFSRIGFWACSTQGDPALEAITSSRYRDNIKAAVFIYAATGKPLKWSKNISLFAVKAGKDPNSALTDSLVKDAKENNVPVEYVEFPNGIPGFDIYQDTQEVKDIIQRVLDFYKKVLLN